MLQVCAISYKFVAYAVRARSNNVLMRISRFFAIALLGFVFSLQCLSQVHVPPPPSGGITVENIISLSNSGVSAETLVGQIRMRSTPLSPTPSQLAQMRDAGVNNAVIQAAVGGSEPIASAASIEPPAPASSSAPAASGSTPASSQPAKPAPSTSRAEFQRAEVVGGYSYLNVDTNGLTSRQSMNGWESSVSINILKNLAVESDVSGYYKNDVLGSGVNVRDYAVAGGPRFNFRPVFFHALLGVDHLSGHAYGLSASQNSFAAVFGGGVQYPFAPHWAVRTAFDYVLTNHDFFGGTATQNNFRVGVGVVYLFGPVGAK